jgi:hypothetical protein
VQRLLVGSLVSSPAESSSIAFKKVEGLRIAAANPNGFCCDLPVISSLIMNSISQCGAFDDAT